MDSAKNRSLRKLAAPAIAAAVALSFAAAANATFVNDSPTGLTSPAFTQNFTSPSLPCDTVVTSQFAYVSFSPYAYLCPQSGFGIPPNTIGNFTFATEPAFVDPMLLTFSSTQTSAVFLMAADGTPYSFEALLSGTEVDSGASTVSGASGYYGFTGDTFNEILITQTGAGDGPYWLLGNLELSSAAVTAVPEPATLGLFGGALLSALLLRRRRTR